MNLIVDFGNTLIKAALFKGREKHAIKSFDNVEELISFTNSYDDIFKCIFCSVTDQHKVFSEQFIRKFRILEFTSQTKTPLTMAYRSVPTLGTDRLAASVGAYQKFPNKNVLVIDAGTCLKFNFTNANNEFMGGSISPGLQMRFKALQHYTGKLPLIDLNENFEKLIGQTTEESILSGVINGIVGEIGFIIASYKKNYPDLQMVLTGGDSAFFEKRLKNSIFAEPDLILIGLNEILELNN